MTMMMSREKMQMWKGEEAIIIGIRNLKLFLKFILLSFLSYLNLYTILIFVRNFVFIFLYNIVDCEEFAQPNRLLAYPIIYS